MLESDCVTVVDVSHRNSSDVRRKLTSFTLDRIDGISRKTEIDESNVVTRMLERGRNAGEPVRNNGIWLTLAICADEKNFLPRIVQRMQIDPTMAPMTELRKFTMSFSMPGMPPARTVMVPHE